MAHLWDATRADVQMLRATVANEIERLISLLDEIDGNPDLEPGGDDEPSLGWTWTHEGMPVMSNPGGDDREREDEHDEDGGDDEDGADDEPSLGWATPPAWCAQPIAGPIAIRGEDDLECDIADVPHDQADEGDDEPSLGRLETVHQGRGSYGGSEPGIPDRNAWAQGSALATTERPADAIGFLRVVPMRRG